MKNIRNGKKPQIKQEYDHSMLTQLRLMSGSTAKQNSSGAHQSPSDSRLKRLGKMGSKNV